MQPEAERVSLAMLEALTGDEWEEAFDMFLHDVGTEINFCQVYDVPPGSNLVNKLFCMVVMLRGRQDRIQPMAH